MSNPPQKPTTPPPPETKQPRQPKPPTDIEIYFDTRDGSYWYRIGNRYVSLKRTDLYMHLRSRHGLRDDIYYEGLRELDYPLYHAQNNRMIDYAGSLSGHKTGVFKDGSGRSFLVTDQPAGIWDKLEKKLPEPEFFKAFIQELLPEDQWQYFCYWLAISLKALEAQNFIPGQVVILCGPAKCGKSLLQGIITQILGGRVADPCKFFFKETHFNQDLISSEHWMMEDPRTTTDIRARRDFGETLKQSTVNRNFTIHPKNKDALTLPILRRVTISINNQPENLAVCPPMEAALADKLFLLLCQMVEKAMEPFRKASGELDQAALWAKVMEEIPLIRNWLLKRFKRVPRDLQDDRFGVKSYHHPELLEALSSLAPETRLLQLVDQVLFPDTEVNHTDWEGKSIDLEKRLRSSDFAFETEKVLRFIGACGSYLGKLEKSQPTRISKRKVVGHLHWTIKPPTREETK